MSYKKTYLARTQVLNQVSDDITRKGYRGKPTPTKSTPVVQTKWQIACRTTGYYQKKKDTKEPLEALGFTIIRQIDDLMYEVTPPDKWTYEESGYWTDFKDASGTTRIRMFYKGDRYDRDAFLGFTP